MFCPQPLLLSFQGREMKTWWFSRWLEAYCELPSRRKEESKERVK
jgi:hypothetical protein